MSLKNRRGVIEISDDAMVNDPNEKYLGALWSNVFPVKIEHEPWKHANKIWCMSLLFREVKQGDKIPEYVLEFTLRDGVITVKAKER